MLILDFTGCYTFLLMSVLRIWQSRQYVPGDGGGDGDRLLYSHHLSARKHTFGKIHISHRSARVKYKLGFQNTPCPCFSLHNFRVSTVLILLACRQLSLIGRQLVMFKRRLIKSHPWAFSGLLPGQ